jgi:mannitol/fructose-specific phosphotransferase system IIA component (Ntr-type)
MMDLLSVDNIKMNVEVPDWKAAVRAVGRILVENGAAEDRYVEAMVNLAAELGPYIVMTPGIAIPHARPEEGARKVGFAAVKLATPINFGNEDNDPVYLVLGFCTPDANAHIDLLTKIASVLEKGDILDSIKIAKTPEDIASLFNQ